MKRIAKAMENSLFRKDLPLRNADLRFPSFGNPAISQGPVALRSSIEVCHFGKRSLVA
jgi:hypothetical protein